MDTMDDEQLHRLLADAEPPAPTQDLAVLASLADLNRRVAAQARAEATGFLAGSPTGSAAGSTAGSAAMNRHASRAAQQVPTRRGRRRAQRTTRVAVLALVATVATGTVAAAGLHAARTGLFRQAGMTENDTSEYIDPAGQDFPAVAAALAPDYVTYAPDTDAAAATDWVVALNRREADTVVQGTGVARNYAAYGQCSWVAAYAVSEPATPERTAATAALVASASWPVFAATDGDGGITRSMNALASAASRGDRSAVEQVGSTLCDEQLLTGLGEHSADSAGGTDGEPEQDKP